MSKKKWVRIDEEDAQGEIKDWARYDLTGRYHTIDEDHYGLADLQIAPWQTLIVCTPVPVLPPPPTTVMAKDYEQFVCR